MSSAGGLARHYRRTNPGHASELRARDLGYQVTVSDRVHDAEWDAFLADAPGGDHAQTSLWANLKVRYGWRVTRIVARRDGQIVGGTQVLRRTIPMVGAVGYVPRGPVYARDEQAVASLVVMALQRIARQKRMHYLLVQPPIRAEAVARVLVAHGFRWSALEPQPGHAVLLDLRKSLDELLAGMRPKTRYNLRLGQRRGITVRVGTEEDLDTFYRLLAATGQRQGFSVESRGYYTDLWRTFAPAGYARLFIAEYTGGPVSAELVIAFGDTVIYKRGAWSGNQGKLHPNEVMHWEVIKWARSQGYRYYDFEGIDPKLAAGIASGTVRPDYIPRSLTSFKLGFGGTVVLSPGTYDYVHNPVLRRLHALAYAQLADHPLITKAEHAVRGMIHG